MTKDIPRPLGGVAYCLIITAVYPEHYGLEPSTGMGIFGDQLIVRVTYDAGRNRMVVDPVPAGVNAYLPADEFHQHPCMTSAPVNGATPCRSDRKPTDYFKY